MLTHIESVVSLPGRRRFLSSGKVVRRLVRRQLPTKAALRQRRRRPRMPHQ